MTAVLGIIQSALAAIAAMPSIIRGFQSLIAFFEEKFGPDWPARLEQLRSASDQWSKAKTTQEREDAAKAMAIAFNSRK